MAETAVVVESIPEELRARPQWVCWRMETREGKPTKVPCRARPGCARASSTDPRTWGTFADASRHRGRFDGIGYVVSADDPYTGVDLDHCLDAQGRLLPWAQVIVERLASYTEITPSGEGVRVWVRGKLPSPGRKRGGVEMYDDARFFTVTGRRVQGTPERIEARQEELAAVHAEVFGGRHKPETQAPRAPARPDDQEVLRAMLDDRRHGGQVAALWRGDWSTFASQSEADLALVNHLAFHTGGDREQADRMFRQSGLMREKWDERRGGQTYGERTIGRAFEGRTRFGRAPAGGGDGRARFEEGGEPPMPLPEMPTIQINGRELRDVTDEVVAAMQAANDPPALFVRGGMPARIVLSEETPPRPAIEALTTAGVRCIMSRCANYIRRTWKLSSQEYVDATVYPPKDVAEQVLSLGAWPFPRLAGLVEAPCVRPDGSLLLEPGYDARTALFYVRDPALRGVSVPDPVRREHVDAALDLLVEMLLDFPFVDSASEDNMLGLLLAPILRPAIEGPTMMAAISAPMAGTGKSLLAEIVSLVATGKRAAMLSYGGDDEEMRKVITSVLGQGAPIVTMDNVTHLVSSGKLAQALSSTIWQDRTLGGNRMVSVPQRAIWIATGNNLRTGGDMRRRLFWVLLDARVSDPESRTNFHIPHLLPWVKENRARILSALLTLVRWWVQAGAPRGKTPRVGTFEEFSEKVGGVLGHAGREHFLGNLEQMRALGDEERGEWEGFLWAWHQRWGSAPMTLNNVAAELQHKGELQDALPSVLADRIDAKGFTRSLGRHLSGKCEVRHGPEGIRVERGSGDGHTKASTWRVVVG